MKLALLGGKPVRKKPFTAWPIFGKSEEARLLRTLRSGKWGRLQGKEVQEFEGRFAEMHGCKQGIAVVNGTVSLRISLMAAGIQAGNEVIVPPYTFVSTATAVIEANAVPVFADIDLETFNIDPRAIEAAITPRTRAIIPVHFAGQVAEMDAILKIARKHKLIVIEDAAHAHGAFYGEPGEPSARLRDGTTCGFLECRAAGSMGDTGSFSFQSSKNLTSGEGGIITTSDDKIAAACRSIHSCGRVEGGLWYEHHVIAGNYRLGEFQGAILNAQLDRLEAQTKRRDANGQYLAKCLSRLPGLHPQKRIKECARHSYHLFMMRVVEEEFGVSRATVLKALQAEGIPCSGGYAISLPAQPLFRNKAFAPYLPGISKKLNFAKARVPNSDLICREQGLWLEQSMLLGPRADMDNIATAFEKIYENRDALKSLG